MSDILISSVEPTNYYYIYKTTNLITSAFYIGQHYSTTTSAFDGYIGSGAILKKNIKKYGRENFKREILEFCTSANIDDREIFYIAQTSACKSIYPDSKGMNISIGGEAPMRGMIGQNHPRYGKHLTDETKKKMSESRIGKTLSEETKKKIRDKVKGKNNYFFGKKHTDDTRIKMSDARKGRILSNKTKAKISATNSGEKNPMYGRKHSDETRNKISDKVKGENSYFNKYNYTLSNGQDYWSLSKNQRGSITKSFRRNNKDTITYKGIQVTRTPKVS